MLADREAEERRKHIEEDGQISVGDEIRLLEQEVEKMARHLGDVRRRADGEARQQSTLG